MPPTSRSASPETLRLAEDLRRVTGDLVRAVRLHADTPSTAQSETLGLLDRKGPSSIADLAKHRRVKHQSMRLVVGQLEAAALVLRMSDPEDGRRQRIVLTKAGKAALSSARKMRAVWMADALQNHLSSHERRALQDAIRLLGRVIEAAKD